VRHRFPLTGKRRAQLRYLADKLARADAGLVPLLTTNLQAVLRQLDQRKGRSASPEGGEGSEGEDAAPLDPIEALPAALAAGAAAGSPAHEQGGADGAGAAAPAVSFAYLRQLATRDDITLTKGAHRLLREWASYAGLQQPGPGQAAASQTSTAGTAGGLVSAREIPGALSDVEGLEGEWESVGPEQQQPPMSSSQSPRAVSINSEDQQVLQKLISLGHVDTQFDAKPRWTDFEGRRVVVESTSKPRQLQVGLTSPGQSVYWVGQVEYVVECWAMPGRIWRQEPTR